MKEAKKNDKLIGILSISIVAIAAIVFVAIIRGTHLAKGTYGADCSSYPSPGKTKTILELGCSGTLKLVGGFCCPTGATSIDLTSGSPMCVNSSGTSLGAAAGADTTSKPGCENANYVNVGNVCCPAGSTATVIDQNSTVKCVPNGVSCTSSSTAPSSGSSTTPSSGSSTTPSSGSSTTPSSGSSTTPSSGSSTTPSSGTEVYTCSVAISYLSTCDGTMIPNGKVVLRAQVTVKDASNQQITSSGRIKSTSWSGGGSGGSVSSGTIYSNGYFSDTIISANSVIGGTVTATYNVTLNNGNTCRGSKTVTVVNCNGSDCNNEVTKAPSAGCYACNSGILYLQKDAAFPESCNKSPISGYSRNGSTNYCVANSVSEPSNGGGGNGGGNGGGGSSSNPTTSNSTPSSPSSNAIVNPQTGTAAMIFAWVIGLIAIGYSFWYFKKINNN